ncbi:hypothetical protein Dhaf_1837 [Desulfitobacterium hafniense DCB-2]|uniref:Uncharacterized protein n=1 Tax=Desulfitobacterium hafniense (strain DSM 10664 / DCB-2) TaxID=272564 RepID=B8FQI9_DESHD|nr:hypothetical protein [Desulfitobacterium hafniense]ACL19879.1 hypothetical protein Dhaf_1837 [Desulfitobacterium hafniense DCB-2]
MLDSMPNTIVEKSDMEQVMELARETIFSKFLPTEQAQEGMELGMILAMLFC